MLTAEPKRKRRKRSPDETVFVYGLVCPRTNLVRYVGKTHSVYTRLFGHIAQATNPDTQEWFLSLILNGQVPLVITLEVTTEVLSGERELAWIRYFHLRHGDLLLNRSGVPNRTIGRRPVTGTTRDKVLPPIRVTAQELSAYKSKCEQKGESLSKVVRRLLNRWVKR